MTKSEMTKPLGMTTDRQVASHSFGFLASGQLENSGQPLAGRANDR